MTARAILTFLFITIFFGLRMQAEENVVNITSETKQYISDNDSLTLSRVPELGEPTVTMNNHISHPHKAGVYYPENTDTIDTNRNWWHLFKKNQLAMNDTTVKWPKFLKFCVDVYRWGDRVFNSYDTAYVIGTGRRWKARVVNDNWTDSYVMRFNKDMYLLMQSDIYCHLGAYLQYMAVSVGYNIDMTNIIGNKPTNHKKFDFGFTCARFNASLTYSENSGGTYLRKFGDYNSGKRINIPFEGLNLRSLNVDAYYIFNNRKYAEGAAFGFARLQIKSAGTLVAGFNYANQDLTLDFKKLNPKLLPYLTIADNKYRFHYDTYSFIVGYAYNWVITRHLLYNISVLPSLGWNKCYEDSSEGRVRQFTFGVNGKTSLTYNIGDFFAAVVGKADLHWYNSKKFSIISSIFNFSLSAGVRF